MPGFEKHDSIQGTYPTLPPHEILQSAWGPNAQNIQKQASNALDQFGQFCLGFGDGVNHFATETSDTVRNAISNPSKTVHDVSEGGAVAVKASAAACAAGADYLKKHFDHHDFAGIVKDTKSSCDALSTVAAHSIDQFNHLSAREKGYIAGHDVAPVVIGTVLAPELLPEGTLAAGFGKVTAMAGALVKDEQIAVSAASIFNGAIERIHSISEKISAMTAKLDELKHSAEMEKRLQRAEKLYHLAGAGGDWEKIGERACATAVKQLHPNACVAAIGEMLTEGSITQHKLQDAMGGIWGRQMLEHMAKAGKLPQYSVEWLQHEIGWKTVRWGGENTRDELAKLLQGHLPFGAEMRSGGAHTIVVDGLEKATGNLLIRDPADATSYEMKVDVFLKHWAAAIFKPNA